MINQSRTRPVRRARKGPAEGVIWSKERAQKASKQQGGGQLRNGFRVQFEVLKEMAYDLDQRKLVEYVTVGMAEYFRARLRAGERPDQGRLPESKSAKNATGRTSPWVGMFSGYMADHWWLGKITGSSLRAARLVKVYGGDGGPSPPGQAGPGRAGVIKALLSRKKGGPVDFQSIRGRAAVEMERLFNEAVNLGFGEVRTYEVPRTREGTLPEVRR